MTRADLSFCETLQHNDLPRSDEVRIEYEREVARAFSPRHFQACRRRRMSWAMGKATFIERDSL